MKKPDAIFKEMSYKLSKPKSYKLSKPNRKEPSKVSRKFRRRPKINRMYEIA